MVVVVPVERGRAAGGGGGPIADSAYGALRIWRDALDEEEAKQEAEQQGGGGSGGGGAGGFAAAAAAAAAANAPEEVPAGAAATITGGWRGPEGAVGTPSGYYDWFRSRLVLEDDGTNDLDEGDYMEMARQTGH